jgi:Predicted membrane protein
VAGSINRRAVRWLRGQLPELVAAGAISSENAAKIEHHYASVETRSNFGFVILATVGAAFLGAGIILLIAHNWDDLSRTTRTIIAFIPLVIALALVAFVLLQRNESRPWREAVAIFDFAAVATAISLISQTYQISGSFADFMKVWLLLCIPMVYLLRSAFGAVVYAIGLIVWLFAREMAFFVRSPNPMFFWIAFLLVVPYFLLRYWKDRESRECTALSIALVIALTFGMGFTADFAKSDLGSVAFAGLFTAIYLAGIRFFPRNDDRLHIVALLGGIGIGVTAICLSFESSWHMTREFFWGERTFQANIAFALEFLFPLAAIAMAAIGFSRGRSQFSWPAAVFPIVTAIGWGLANLCDKPAERWLGTRCSFTAAALMNCYALWLGIDILVRGIRANSVARANFGLLLIAALAISRFFDSELSFVTRGLGFIVVGAGFLVANVLMFKKRSAAPV